MAARRLTRHPVLAPLTKREVSFEWCGRSLAGFEGEPLSSALWANGIKVLGHHPKDGAPRTLFCANGLCAQCLVLVDGRPKKACVTHLTEGLSVQPAEGSPALPRLRGEPRLVPLEQVAVEVLVIGAGPAGLAAADELGRRDVDTLLVDDRPILGGKLVLQTHRFFGSRSAARAGARGYDIATRLERDVRSHASVIVWTDSPVVGVFSDGVVGVLRGGESDGHYALVRPRAVIVATGARERSLCFPGNSLAGVLGAGAFQTLMNRDRVRPAERVLVVGGGNVGLIVAYQALQAGVDVAAIVEAAPRVGGYEVHRAKLERHGVPVLEGHGILAAHGREEVTSATIGALDARFAPVHGTERRLACDGVLLAVGLDSENELFIEAKELGFSVFCAGDASEVREATSAVFSGRIRALEAIRELGLSEEQVPAEWRDALAVHESRPGPIGERGASPEASIVPVLHCAQEIPCDPCASVCPQGGIVIDGDIRHVPRFDGNASELPCVGCEKCLTICPGQAITLVDYRHDPDHAVVIVPYELDPTAISVGDRATAVDDRGQELGEFEVLRVRSAKASDHTLAVRLWVPRAIAQRVAGIRVGAQVVPSTAEPVAETSNERAVVCRCERVTEEELLHLVRDGTHDVHCLKVLSHVGMGACGARTCWPHVRRLLLAEGVPEESLVVPRRRPPLREVALSALADENVLREVRRG